MENKISYSQSGEDLIIDFIFDSMKIESRRYLDIGSNHPIKLNNTYRFYTAGHRGVCIEPDPDLCKKIKNDRPDDIVLNMGVGKNKAKLPFYLMDPDTLNTFSEKEAKAYQEHYPWSRIRKVMKIKIVNINDIIKKYFKNGVDILSIDTEGLDLEIVESIEFKKYHPAVICVETAIYKDSRTLEKNIRLINYLRKHGYFVYSDTFVNTIFVNKRAWLDNNGTSLENF